MLKSHLYKTLIAILFLSQFVGIHRVAAQQKYTLSGYVEDERTGEKLLGATVLVAYKDQAAKVTKQDGAIANNYGFYSITLPENKDTMLLTVSFVGYETKYFTVLLDKNIQQNFKLGEGATLKTVVITASKNGERIEERTQMSVREIPIQQIKQMPALFGETDVLKALQLLPGVSGGLEGTSGFYVRGGSPDQNLILLDGVPVYNASHVGGIFSTFNADAVKDVRLTTGGFPARFGGRLSSVLEINMKEGNNQEFHGEGGIGIIASRLTLEGPIIKNTTSFMVSARRTYIDALIAPILALAQVNQGLGSTSLALYFYDLNAKVNHKISEKDRLYFSIYGGSDVFNVANTTRTATETFKTSGGFNWGNVTSAARWNHLFTDKLFANTTLTYSNYQFNFPIEASQTTGGVTQGISAKYISGIEDWAGKIDFDYAPNPNHFVRFGANVTRHTFKPGATAIKFVQNSKTAIDTTLGAKPIAAYEMVAYGEDDWQITKNFKANLGLHASAFAVDNQFYNSLQPRIGLRYLLPKGIALKASFTTMTQYIHLLVNEGIGLPTDLWVPSTARVKPEQAWQAAVGGAMTVAKDYELSAELYYKKMENLMSYTEGASFFGQTDWQDKVTQGNGRAYGLELMFQKKTGNTTGWIGYTLSRSERQFNDINFGRVYPFKYDRPHDFELVVMHKFSEKIRLSGSWQYSTGVALSLPLLKYQGLGASYSGNYTQPITYYGEKNSYRMPDFHRLDLSIEFHKKKRRYERTWVLGVYNAYNRQNPFYIFQGNEQDTGLPIFQQLSILPVLPSLSYEFKF